MTTDKPKNLPSTKYQILVVTIVALLQFTIVLDFMILLPPGDFLLVVH